MQAGDFAVYTKRTRLVLVLLVCLAVIPLGCWIIGNDELRLGSPLRWVIAGYGITLGCVLGVIVMGLQLIRRQPVFVYNHTGIRFCGLVSGNWIAWDDIASMHYMEFKGQRMLGFELLNEAATLRNQPLLVSLLAPLNKMTCGYPLAIAESSLPCKLEELVEQFEAVRHGATAPRSVMHSSNARVTAGSSEH